MKKKPMKTKSMRFAVAGLALSCFTAFNAQAAEFKRDEAIRLAEAEKQRNILLAEATAQQTVLEATAEATAIELQGAALRKYPEVMQWEFVQNLKGVQWGILPADGIMPLLQMPKFPN